MLLVKTKLAHSPIHGVGLFADEDIPKGTNIWKWVDGFDIVYTKEQLASFPPQAEAYLIFHAPEYDGKFYQCGDNTRFANHSDNPNCKSILTPDGWSDTAIRDIQRGEEITYNYWEFHRGEKL